MKGKWTSDRERVLRQQVIRVIKRGQRPEVLARFAVFSHYRSTNDKSRVVAQGLFLRDLRARIAEALAGGMTPLPATFDCESATVHLEMHGWTYRQTDHSFGNFERGGYWEHENSGVAVKDKDKPFELYEDATYAAYTSPLSEEQRR